MTKKEVKDLWDWWYDEGWVDATLRDVYNPPSTNDEYEPAYIAGYYDGLTSEDLI